MLCYFSTQCNFCTVQKSTTISTPQFSWTLNSYCNIYKKKSLFEPIHACLAYKKCYYVPKKLYQQTNSKSSNFAFSDTHIKHLQLRFCSFQYFLLALTPNAYETAQRNENVFLNMSQNSIFCIHFRPGKLHLIRKD